MKKTTLFLIFSILASALSSYAQTLNQGASWPNSDWTLTGTYNVSALLSDPTTGDATFGFNDDAAGSSSNDDLQLTSPIIDLTDARDAGETWITVSGDIVYRALSGEVLAIEVYDADAMTWSVLETFTGNSTNTDFQTCANVEAYTSAIFDISGYTATQLSGFQYRFSYDDDDAWKWGWCLGSPTIASQTPPACLDPSMLTAGNITDTTADLSWTENGTATAWDIEIVDSGVTATGNPTANGVTNPYTAMSLTAVTAYDFYVRADCGVDGTSEWVGPFTFTTECDAITAEYIEDFETFTTQTSAFVEENCWSATGGSYYWESAPGTDTGSGSTGPDPSITTGNYFYVEATGGSAGDVTDLVSPLVDLAALATPTLMFNYHMYGSAIGTLDVLVNGTTNVWSLSGEQQADAVTPWDLAVIDLSSYAGQTISITFRATSAGTYQGDLAIDNVAFTELPTCPFPTGLTATNVGETTADLSWVENGTATMWNIEWGVAPLTQGTGTMITGATSNPLSLSALTPSTTYEYYVQADCGGEASDWTGPYSFTTMTPAPANDDASGAIALSVGDTLCETQVTASTAGATTSIEADADCGSTPGTDVWFSVVVPVTGEVNIEISSVDGSVFGDSVMAVYSGTVGALVEIECDDDGGDGLYSMIELVGLTEGDVIYVRVWEYGYDEDEFNICAWSPTSLSVADNTFESFNYYPNPVNDNLTLKAQKDIENIAVYNMLGQEVLRTAPNAVNTEVNMSALQAGAYFVKVTIGDATETVKVIKK